VKKYGTTEQGAGDNMAHAHYMLDASNYKQTLRIYNTYCFSTAKNGSMNAPECYVIYKIPALFI